ncbi:uncharacterized protein BBA_10288 [Beauveria bassiana ARSEF 2860]|uniref:Uncharacterized protein n=1 Tax=Beauveria bassiana (strain ARSEF 2860) TaxID=655819 RepID=J5J1J4_BEAB2|nr:uncharacterized protein BBA_10288 [Beauveria bassiana ARSEF 2860]EJP60768.1 hypothetical protein BBA_10288 [Beauveria bassiana ARSEF 2860]
MDPPVVLGEIPPWPYMPVEDALVAVAHLQNDSELVGKCKADGGASTSTEELEATFDWDKAVDEGELVGKSKADGSMLISTEELEGMFDWGKAVDDGLLHKFYMRREIGILKAEMTERFDQNAVTAAALHDRIQQVEKNRIMHCGIDALNDGIAQSRNVLDAVATDVGACRQGLQTIKDVVAACKQAVEESQLHLRARISDAQTGIKQAITTARQELGAGITTLQDSLLDAVGEWGANWARNAGNDKKASAANIFAVATCTDFVTGLPANDISKLTERALHEPCNAVVLYVRASPSFYPCGCLCPTPT